MTRIVMSSGGIGQAHSACCVFRIIVTGRFGIVTAEFGNVTGHFGDVTDRLLGSPKTLH